MAALLCLAAVAGVRAGDFGALRAQAAGRTVRLAPGTQLEALVVSDYRSQNMELNPNSSYEKVDLGENLRTAYIESPDGRYGFRLRFAGIYENRLERGDRVRLDLGGCSLTGEADPERYTVDGLRAANVEVLERGVALPGKERRIADLKDEDLYTYVTLTGTEFLSKQGAMRTYSNRASSGRGSNAFRPAGRAAPTGGRRCSRMPTTVRFTCSSIPNARGGATAAAFPTASEPSRASWSIPRCAVTAATWDAMRFVRSTSATSPSPATRPPPMPSSPSGTGTAITTPPSASRSRATRPASRSRGVAGDRVLPDAGEGFLSTTSGARMRLDTEYDTRYAQDGDGKAMRVNAALRLDSDTHDWFRFDSRGRMSGAEAVVVETSTEGIEGRGLSFDFSFLAGNHDINRSWGYPVEWKVEYSADGLPFIDAGRIF